MKTKIFHTLSPLLVASLLLPTSLFGVEVHYEPDLPSGAVITHALPAETNAGSITWRRTSDDERTDVIQAFTPMEDFTLEQIVVFTPGASTTAIERPFSIIIEEYDGFRPDSPRTVVATESGILPELNVGSKYAIFRFTSPIPLKGEVLYSFRLVFDQGTPSSSLALRTIPGVFEDKFSAYVRPVETEKPILLQQNLEFSLIGTPAGSN